MTEIEKIYKEIITNIAKIEKLSVDNVDLKLKLEKLQLEDWQPDRGNYVVDSCSKVFDWTEMNLEQKTVDDLVDFGSVRITQKRAELASINMKAFNRLSCYMGDTKPTYTFTDYSVGLTFYDYDSDKIKKLKKIIEIKGKL